MLKIGFSVSQSHSLNKHKYFKYSIQFFEFGIYGHVAHVSTTSQWVNDATNKIARAIAEVTAAKYASVIPTKGKEFTSKRPVLFLIARE